MTKPKLARDTRRDDGPRTYPWPPIQSGLPVEFEFVGVTSATNNFPKPWLTPWAVKQTAERAVDKYRRLGEMIEEDGEKEALAWLKKARFTASGDKADRGTVVHGAIEAYLNGDELSNEALEKELKERRVPRSLWRSTAGMVAGVFKFLEDLAPKVVHSEQSVYSKTHRYAGTPDILGFVQDEAVVIDIKTSKDIYKDTALQLCAYARAEFAGNELGEELPILGVPIEKGIVVRPMADGTYEHAEFDLTDDVFEMFLACVALTRAEMIAQESMGDVKKGVA